MKVLHMMHIINIIIILISDDALSIHWKSCTQARAAQYTRDPTHRTQPYAVEHNKLHYTTLPTIHDSMLHNLFVFRLKEGM